MPYILIFILCFVIIVYNIFVIFFYIKISYLKKEINLIFKKRNYQVASIYSISQDLLVKHDEVFEEFLLLKNRDFSENLNNLSIEGKLQTYKKIHNEINFIFKVCDKHNTLQKNEIYNYIKDSIVEKSAHIGKKYSLYVDIKKKYKKFLFFSKLSGVGFFLAN